LKCSQNWRLVDIARVDHWSELIERLLIWVHLENLQQSTIILRVEENTAMHDRSVKHEEVTGLDVNRDDIIKVTNRVNNRFVRTVVGPWNNLHTPPVSIEKNRVAGDGDIRSRHVLEVVVKKTGVNLIFLIAHTKLCHHGFPTKDLSETRLHVVQNRGHTPIVHLGLTYTVFKLLKSVTFEALSHEYKTIFMDLSIDILETFWVHPRIVKSRFPSHLDPYQMNNEKRE
jgi:hypothetical protein